MSQPDVLWNTRHLGREGGNLEMSGAIGDQSLVILTHNHQNAEARIVHPNPCSMSYYSIDAILADNQVQSLF